VYVKFKIWNVVTDNEAKPYKNTDFLTLNDGSVAVTQWKINQVTLQVSQIMSTLSPLGNHEEITKLFDEP
jgi:hypothetical protein